MLQNVALLRQFLAVAKGGSISAGAAALSISQPAASKAIHRLEQDLGVALFARRARGVVLTRFGESLLRHAKRIETEWNFAQSELGAFRTGRTGHLRIGAGLYFGAALLPPALVALHARFPRLRVDLTIGANPRTMPRLLSGDLDLVVARIPTARLPDFVETRRIADVRMCVVAASDHPLARQRRIAGRDLANHPWVVYLDDDETVASREAMFRRMGSPPPHIAVESTSLTAIFQLLRTGRYLGCIASGLVGASAGAGLVEIPLPSEPARFRAGAMYARTLANVAPITALIELLRAEAAARARPARA
jgi:DNA-binding transcriptional LysR family regulator